ncbi:MAG: hypothetical protein JWM98_827 [Thermoleophilia bacterium]|nr:hypothetical protein [Thermoleophilia bacterium]
MPPQLRSRSRAHVGALLAIVVVAAVASSGGAATGATSGTVVGATVPATTSLGTAGCPTSTTNVTDFGTLVPGTSNVTSSNCVVAWGSSNSSSMLRAYQSDGVGTTMGATSNVWATRGTPDTGYNFDVAAADASTAFVAAGGVGVRTTTNSGSGWTTVSLAGENVTEVAAAPGASTTAIATSTVGGIYRTTNTGTSWPAEASGTVVPLRDATMVDATNAFAVGDNGVVRKRTTAGGSTWLAATSVGTSPLRAVSAVSTSVLFVGGIDGVAARSPDGGATWATVSGCTGISDIVATNATTAYATHYGGSISTISWSGSALTCTPITANVDIGEDLRSIDVGPGGVLWAAGVRGTLMRSSNAGATWQRIRPASAMDFDGVATPADGSVWLGGSSGTVVRSPTGASFAVVRVETTDSTSVQDMVSFSDHELVTVGGQVDRGATWQASIRTTTDGGTTWTSRTSNTTEALFSVSGSRALLVAVGDDGVIDRSLDAGATWSAAQVAPGVRLWGVDMVDEFTGWAVGDGGTILRTVNGGDSWVAQASPVTTGLRAVSAVDANLAFAIGMQGRILRTTDGGATWTALAGVPTAQALDDVVAVDASTVYVAYGYQTMLASTNASAGSPTWTNRSTGSGQDSLAIDAVSRAKIFVSTAWGYVASSTDGGVTWITTSVASGNSFTYAVDALDENTVWAGGSMNNIVRMLPQGGATDFGDYADAGPNWSSGTAMFGACLMASTGVNVTPVWTVDGICGTSGTGVWRGIAATSALPAAKVAGASAATSATSSFRFGVRVPANQPAGRYSAGINFEVLAPDA